MNLTIDQPTLVIEADHKRPSLQLTGVQAQGISPVCLDGNDEMIDILRLTCIENGSTPAPLPAQVALKAVGGDFQIVYKDAATAKRGYRTALHARGARKKQSNERRRAASLPQATCMSLQWYALRSKPNKEEVLLCQSLRVELK